MSRCFPFPPPGYVKEIRPNVADPLPLKSQEKPKEKKHKKEKKDKEKKEKKDKETSKDKHKEKKEKKEKHKDRKDKNRDKDKKKTSEEKDAKALPNTVDKEKLATNSLQNNINGDSKFVEDLARRIREEEEATESQSAQKITSPYGKSSGVTVKNNTSCQIPQINHRKDDDKRINNHKNSSMAKKSENLVPQAPLEQKRAEVMAKPMEKRDQAKQMELQVKNHHKESVTKGDKPWDLKKNELKSIDKSKEKEVITEVINNIGQKKPKFVEGGPRLKEKEQNSVDTRNFRMQDLSKGSVVVKNHTNEGILGKRKGLEANGLLYENGTKPNKMQKPVASPVLENGRKLGSCQIKPKATSEQQRSVCTPEVKEHRINGFIDVQEPKTRPPIPSGAAMKPLVKENGEASVKRPHSDLKYLDQILNVPKRKEMDEVDEDQEWLIGQSDEKSKKIRTESSGVDESLQVWNQALRVESADIIALPYVVPF